MAGYSYLLVKCTAFISWVLIIRQFKHTKGHLQGYEPILLYGHYNSS